MPPETKPVQKKEPSFAPEAVELLRDGFAQKGVDLRLFYSQAQGHVKSLVSVREGGTLAGREGIRFADGTLYVGRKVFEQYKSDPAGFAKRAIKAVRDGLEEKTGWDKEYAKSAFERDAAFLQKLYGLLDAKQINKAAVPARADSEKWVMLEGEVSVPQSIHKLYQSLSYAKDGIFLNEQAFGPAYSAYLRGVQAHDIKPGLFIIADYNLHRSHKRFYVVDFGDPKRPVVLDAFKVAHGFGSDSNGWVVSVSNKNLSYQSSRGIYAFKSSEWRTDKDFRGYVWRLEGVDSSDFLALDRGILLHIKHGRRTAGCFGLDPADADSVGLPLASNSAGQNPENFEKWKGVGLFVTFSSRVQDVCKKYWKPQKEE